MESESLLLLSELFAVITVDSLMTLPLLLLLLRLPRKWLPPEMLRLYRDLQCLDVWP